MIRKHCNVCGSWYSLEQFAELTPPPGGAVQPGDSETPSQALRQCTCDNTLAVPVPMLDAASVSVSVVPVFAAFEAVSRSEQNGFAWQTVKAMIGQESHPTVQLQLTRALYLMGFGLDYDSDVMVDEGHCIHCEEKVRTECFTSEVLRKCGCGTGGSNYGPLHPKSDGEAEEDRAEKARDAALTKARELLSGKPTNDAIGKASVILMKLNEENNR